MVNSSNNLNLALSIIRQALKLAEKVRTDKRFVAAIYDENDVTCY